MKTRLYYILIAITGFSLFTACKKMDSTYKQFIVEGGITYPGKAKSAVLHGGNKRAKLVWLRGTDPKIVKTKIFWNSNQDSVEVNIPAGQDLASYTFNNLQENYYIFSIKNYDAKGRQSVAVEVGGNVYGEKYQSRILERPINTAYLKNSNILSINWNVADTVTGAYKTEVEYTSTAGMLKTVRFNAAQLVTDIADYRQGTSLKYRTLYLPDTAAIDTFYTSYLIKSEVLLDKKEWTLTAFSDQYSSGNEAAKNMIDGNQYTRWHTNGSAYPHWITVDMGAVRTIKRFSTLNSLYDGPGGDNRAPIRIRFEVSMDNVTWTNAGEFSSNNTILSEQFYQLPAAATGRYFKLTGLQGPAGNSQYMVLGEVSAYMY
ncbi:DUF4998 domain-containing protein [Pedobacter sp. GR22-6]|uniref:DUF4998 domain-containing protein n=1 Tax=Pedobacter sp. GR22-6 TaxID=3127957 RepID=UPI00307ECCBF